MREINDSNPNGSEKNMRSQLSGDEEVSSPMRRSKTLRDETLK